MTKKQADSRGDLSLGPVGGAAGTPLATPTVVPPRMPATWVPWPLQSSVEDPTVEGEAPLFISLLGLRSLG